MKKIFFLLASVILLACSENERMVYDEHMHDIYYSIVTDTRDSLYVSLLMADQILETTVDVKMLGNVLTKPQKFKVEVVGERTDAKEGIHYEKLPEFYEFPAGEFIYKMPVRLIKGDAAIKQKPVTLTLRLVATGDLGVAYADKSEIRLLIAEMTGHDFWEDTYGSGNGNYGIYYEEDYYTPYARKLYKIITGSEIRDETGKVMQGWNVP